MTTLPSISRTRCGLVAFIAAIGFMLAAPASAHLAIIWQGPESRGVAEPGDQFGFVLAAGDFNGDGIDDLATGAPTEDLDGVLDAGAVVISYGSELGITHVGAALLTRETASETPAQSDQFGFALAAGDLNGDGIDDLAVGVPGATSGGQNAAGAVLFFRGTPGGLVDWFTIYQSSLGGADEAFDRFGSAIAFGNLDTQSPARLDVVIGGPGEDSNAGVVYYVMGTAGGPVGAAGWFKQDDLGGGNEVGDQFGYAVACGNVQGSGADDILAGAPFEDLAGVDDVGVVFVIPGSSSGPTATGSHYVSAAAVDAPLEDGWFGFSVATGHLMDAAGYETLAVGEPGRDFGSATTAGRVVILPGAFFGPGDGGEYGLNKIQVGGLYIRSNEYFGYAIAVGDFDTPSAYDDLAMGSPYDYVSGLGEDSGKVFLEFGGPAGPDHYGNGQFNQFSLHDAVEGGELLGAAFAFGAFDGTGRGNLATSAKGEDASAGQVHVIAPWRQVFDLYCETSAGTDCDGNLVFSQKPFDEVAIASTTKIMTVLLACERISLDPSHPDYLNPAGLYFVPNWIVDQMGGTTYLARTEIMSLENLLYVCLLLSANDAAYEIGNILTGEPGPIGIPVFAAQMNTRAAQIGMTRTLFTNAAGFEKDWIGPSHAGENHSTAADMVKLGRVAMENEYFRMIAGAASHDLTRLCTNGSCTGDFTIYNIIRWVNDNPSFPSGNGIKSGYTPKAQLTTTVSAKPFFDGDVIASSFGTANGLNELARANVIDILRIGLAECETFPGIYESEALFEAYLTDASTGFADLAGMSIVYNDDGRDPAHVEICRQSGLSTTTDLVVRRTSQLALGPDGIITLEVEPFESRGPLRIVNLGLEPVTLRVWPEELPDPIQLSLDPGEVTSLAGYGGPNALYQTIFENVSASESVALSVEEVYEYSVEFTEAPCGQTDPFVMKVHRPVGLADEQYEVRVIGTDPRRGSTVAALVHGGSSILGVDGQTMDPASVGGPVRALGAVPNPVRAGGRLRFEVVTDGSVAIEVFDPSGRRVRAFAPEELAAGRWSVAWDGADEHGRPLASGTYFYRVVHPAGDATGRVVVAR